MRIREAKIDDIAEMQRIRVAVKENILSNPSLVPDSMVAEFISVRGKGWVVLLQDQVIGFAIADLKEDNIWALFIDPEFEGQGAGKALHHTMLDWYFNQGKEQVWLSTDTHSRAAQFYRMQGWQEVGPYGKTETKFSLTRTDWKERN